MVVGYVIYGFFMMLVYSMGNGVNGFIYDFIIGVFVLFYFNL